MWAAAIPSIIKGGIGVYQTLRGAFQKEPVRPVKGVTSATQQQLGRAQGLANTTQDQILSSQISDQNRQEGNAVGVLQKNIGSTSDLLAGLGQLEAQKAQARNQAYGDFGGRKFSYENNLLRAYDNLRQEQMDAWQWNKGDKYIEDKIKKQSLIDSGLSNLGAGTSELSTLGLYNNLYGQGKSGNQSSVNIGNPYQKIRNYANKMPGNTGLDYLYNGNNSMYPAA